MIDGDTEDMARNAAASAREAANKGYNGEYAGNSYDAAREYANSGLDVAGRVSENLRDFVQKEPWIAMAGAFAIGYLIARVMRRVSA
jgi:hypothetical protein